MVSHGSYLFTGSEDNSVYVYNKQVSKPIDAKVQVQHTLQPLTQPVLTFDLDYFRWVQTVVILSHQNAVSMATQVSSHQPQSQQPQPSQDTTDFVSSVCWKKVNVLTWVLVMVFELFVNFRTLI